MNSTTNVAPSGAVSADSSRNSSSTDWAVLILSGGPLALFVLLALWDIDTMTGWVDAAFSWSSQVFGAYWQVLLLVNFIIGLGLAFSRAGRIQLGALSAPEMSTFRWVAIILCTLLAGGGVFWSAAEPIAHFVNPPPLFSADQGTERSAYNALAQSFMHWGFLAWAILGSLTSVILMHLHYDRGLPLRPRTLLYPVFGDRVINGWFGSVIDAMCIIAVAAGTIGPIGFLGLQMSFSLSELFGIPDNYLTQGLVVGGLVLMYTISAITGISRGIQWLSRFNVGLGLLLMIYVLLTGPSGFVADGFVQGMGIYMDQFFPMATFRADEGWLGWWTVFFWGWFIGYGPLMAIFVAKISRGRSLRQLITVVSITAPIVTCLWFTVLGGSGLAFELANPGSVSSAFEGFNLPAALLAITQQFPYGMLVSCLFLVLTTIFVATTGDSMTYTISVVMTGDEEPSTSVRVFWGLVMGSSALVLIAIGSGGVDALQRFIVVTAVPVSLILLPSLWTAPKIANTMAREQGIK